MGRHYSKMSTKRCETKEIAKLFVHSIFIIDCRISFYCNNLDLLPPKPKFTFRHLKEGIKEIHRRFALAPVDEAANNVVVI